MLLLLVCIAGIFLGLYFNVLVLLPRFLGRKRGIRSC